MCSPSRATTPHASRDTDHHFPSRHTHSNIMATLQRPLGSTGFSIAPLVLGTNVMGWTVDEPTSFSILDAFVDYGFDAIDTADSYSTWVPGNQGGESETIIGRWLKRDPSKRDRVHLLTKVGSGMPGNGGV